MKPKYTYISELGKICTSRPIFDLAPPFAIPLTSRSALSPTVDQRLGAYDARRHEVHPLWVLTL